MSVVEQVQAAAAGWWATIEGAWRHLLEQGSATAPHLSWLLTAGLVVLCVALGVALLAKRLEGELRLLGLRLGSLEQHQYSASQGIAGLGTGLAQTGTLTHTLVEATQTIRDELARAKSDLAAIQAHARARQEQEGRTAESIRRLEAVLAGTHTKGAAGEHLLEGALARLPADWQVRGFRVGNHTVEFGLRLPNGLVLPIDSKWPATHLLESFLAAEHPEQQLRLKQQIEAVVLAKAREVRKYLDPGLTLSFGIAAVPDAIYELCWNTQAEALTQNVVLISYSMVLPYLLLVFQTVLRSSRDLDLERLSAHLERASECAQLAQEELEGRFARALTMLANSRDEVAHQLSRLNASLLATRSTTSVAAVTTSAETSDGMVGLKAQVHVR